VDKSVLGSAKSRKLLIYLDIYLPHILLNSSAIVAASEILNFETKL
jgi:hypothetical protein